MCTPASTRTRRCPTRRRSRTTTPPGPRSPAWRTCAWSTSTSGTPAPPEGLSLPQLRAGSTSATSGTTSSASPASTTMWGVSWPTSTRPGCQDTVLIYTSDQGFFLGDHGWFDKRFFYEESLRMPSWCATRRDRPRQRRGRIVLNTDFAPSSWTTPGRGAGGDAGAQLPPPLRGEAPADWRSSMYYRYFMHLDSSHNTYAHYGLRSKRYKLIYYYEPEPGPRSGSCSTCRPTPRELRNVYADPAYADVVRRPRRSWPSTGPRWETPPTPGRSSRRGGG